MIPLFPFIGCLTHVREQLHNGSNSSERMAYYGPTTYTVRFRAVREGATDGRRVANVNSVE